MIKKAIIQLVWEDGRWSNLGKLEITADDKIRSKCSHMYLRFGWELVKAGLRMMFMK